MRNIWVRRSVLLGLSMAWLLVSGCIIVVGTGCDWERAPAAWVEETVEVAVDSNGLAALDVKTHNGEIEFAGQPAGGAVTVTARKKAGGPTVEEAREALAAVEIVAERNGGEQKLAWRWKGVKKSRWSGEVAFTIKAPGNLRLDAETENGAVTVNGVVGDVRIETDNGKVIVDSRDGKLAATSHNGAITATYAGPSISLESHNGEIKTDLRQSGPVRGEIVTHNGAIELAVGNGTAADLVASTDNGSVSNQGGVVVTSSSSSRTRLEGKIGAGGGKLELTTHNGAINIKGAS